MTRASFSRGRRLAPIAVAGAAVLLSGSLIRSQVKGDESLKVRPGQVPAVEILPALPPEPLVPPGPAPDLEILFTSQVQGYYQPCG